MIYETPEIGEAIREHRATWGDGHEERVIDQAIEEMAELTVALQKLKRAKLGVALHGDSEAVAMQRVREELADVILCLHFAGVMWDIPRWAMMERVADLAKALTVKVRELRKRMSSKGGGE
jgi:NTP pyrophosphatase (non-canonical NTP hydrolase)